MKITDREIREAVCNDLAIRRKWWGDHPGIVNQKGRFVAAVSKVLEGKNKMLYKFTVPDIYADDWEVVK